MSFCNGQTKEDKRCGKMVIGDSICLAHKLKQLPSEVVTLIFAKIESLQQLYLFTTIYPEAIPAYFQRKLEVGKKIAFDLLDEHSHSSISITKSRQLVDKTIWRMMAYFMIEDTWESGESSDFVQRLNDRRQTITNALEYCLLQFETPIANALKHLMNKDCIKESISRQDITEFAKKTISTFLSVNCIFSINEQMTALAYFLEHSVFLLPCRFARTHKRKVKILYKLISQICEIEVDGKVLFCLNAVNKIFRV